MGESHRLKASGVTFTLGSLAMLMEVRHASTSRATSRVQALLELQEVNQEGSEGLFRLRTVPIASS